MRWRKKREGEGESKRGEVCLTNLSLLGAAAIVHGNDLPDTAYSLHWVD